MGFIIDTSIRRALRKAEKKRPRRRGAFGLDAALHNRLFQAKPGDPDYREAAPRRVYAHDAAPDEATQHLEHALTHLQLVDGGNTDLNIGRLRGYIEQALECLDERADDEDLDREDDDAVTHADEHGGPTRLRADSVPVEEHEEREEGTNYTRFGPALDRRRARRRARDAMGEVPPRSTVSQRNSSAGRRVDHRDDFRSIREGGADSAHGFDGDTLFQRDKRR